jgi:hypothetical protein
VTTRAEDHGKLTAIWGRYGQNLTAALAVALAAWAVIGLNKEQKEQREGRAIAIAVTCSATSAVIDAGRATITGQISASAVTPRLARSLERLGYPPKEVREREARKAAAAYGRFIARRVEAAARTAGLDGESNALVTESGQLDCRKVGKASRVDVDADGDADGR